MAQPYRYDFRQKVIQAIERDGLKQSEASQLFNISRNTIDLWFKRKAATGDVQAKQRQAASKRQQSTDWEQFRAFAKTHEAQTQVEMAHLWQGESSDRTLARALPKLGWTRKKTYGYRERDEAKRLEFLKRMGDPQAAHLVSVDESGMDERDDSGYGWSPAGERIDGLKTGRRQGRVNLIAGSRDGQLIAPFTVTGACNRTVFELWLNLPPPSAQARRLGHCGSCHLSSWRTDCSTACRRCCSSGLPAPGFA